MTSTKLLISTGVIAIILVIGYLAVSSSMGASLLNDSDGDRDDIQPISTEVATNPESTTPITEVEGAPDSSGNETVLTSNETDTVPTPSPTSVVTTSQNSVTTPAPSPAPTPKPSGYTLGDVSKHADATSCWSAIGNSVYDLTPFISRHPGGERNILKICGKDGTALFEGQHDGQSRPESTLAKYLIGPYLN